MNCIMRLLFYNSKIPVKNYFYESKRHLLAATSLGIDRFLEVRKLVEEKIKDKEKFLKEMEEVSNLENSALIFTDDIKKIVMVVTEENIGIIPKLLKKLSLQNETIKFQKYTFGPDIMKLYHLLNKPTEALALVEDKNTVQHFIQITSFSVLADLLFNNGMYHDVICVYQYFHSRAIVHRNAVQAMIVLYFAACYKLNTLASLEEAITLWTKLDSKGVKLHKRALAFFGLHALKHNKPQIGIETLTFSRLDPALFSIKVMSFAKAKRYDDIFATIREGINKPDPLFLTSDAVLYIKDQLTNNKVEYIPKFNQLMDECRANKFLSNKLLEDLIFEEVEVHITYKKHKEFKQ